MFWKEEKKAKEFQVPENVLDLSFKIKCRMLPVDHAWLLRDAMTKKMPWLLEEKKTAIHQIHISESANGWERPEEQIHLSRRTRLRIRVPHHRIEDTLLLTGQAISVAGNELIFGEPEILRLSPLTTLVSRYVPLEAEQSDENHFLSSVYEHFQQMGVSPGKMLCGKMHSFSTPEGNILTRSLMVSDITPAQSVILQENGLGEHQLMGLGIFIPQKGIKAVNESEH